MPSGFQPASVRRWWISPCSSGVTFERDVPERRRRQVGIEQVLVVVVGELEEGQRAAVTQAEERVAVDALRPEQLVGLGPRGHQREADEALVERPGRLQVLGDVRVVVQPARQLVRGGHGPSLGSLG